MKANVEVVTNRGPNTTEAELKRILRQAKRADLAVAFVSVKGVNALIGQLTQVASKGCVRILTGLYQDVTDHAALVKLLNTQRRLEGRLQVRISRTPHFHEKLYLAHHATSLHVLVGSSNLSQDGLLALGELNISQQFAKGTSAARKFVAEFDKLWADHESVPLTKALIALYSERHRKLPKPTNPLGAPTFAKIIRAGRDLAETKAEVPMHLSRYWRDNITGFVKRVTEQIIQKETNWDARGWDWFSCGPHKYRSGDSIVFLDHANERVYCATVKDTTEVSTPDGRHFVAFKKMARLRVRNMNHALWSELKEASLVKSKASGRNPRKLLSRRQVEAVSGLFKRAVRRKSTA